MKVSVSHEQLAALAQAIDNQAVGGEQGYDLIARSFGFRDKAEMLASSTKKELRSVLHDWRQSDALAEQDTPLSEPVPVVVFQEDYFVDIYVGGANEDPYGKKASSVRVEREGNATRILLFDSLCDASRTFVVEDGRPLAEADHDWEAMDESPEPGQPEP